VSRPDRRTAAMMAMVASASWFVMFVGDRIVSGVVQCSTLGCLPNGGA
jgi:hypothetical protein